MLYKEDTYKPKYIQLVEILRQHIVSGLVKGGDKLLSENELRNKYGVSLTTVRKCIDILRNEGLIQRVQGVGTFVVDRPVKRSLEKVLSFTHNMQQVGLVPTTDVLEKKILRATNTYGEKLKVRPDEYIFRLKRLRFGNDIPMLLETRYINLRYCPGIDLQNLAGSLYDIYEKSYEIILTRAHQNLKIVFLKEQEAKLLTCKAGDPAFYVTGVTYSESGDPIEYEESLYRSDEYEFFVEVGRTIR
ncbi:MAG: GntR family transcriptional regulator [Spirochaetes bacterium]|nr:GntR family transcriptional regulator [Spirochaetota bacterium]